jgi:hypothetical protein
VLISLARGLWSEIRAEIAIEEFVKLYGCDVWQEE